MLPSKVEKNSRGLSAEYRSKNQGGKRIPGSQNTAHVAMCLRSHCFLALSSFARTEDFAAAEYVVHFMVGCISSSDVGVSRAVSAGCVKEHSF